MSGDNHSWPQQVFGVRLPFGWWVGFSWTGTQGRTSRTSAMIASRHPRGSITWTFGLYATRSPVDGRWRLSVARQKALYEAKR